MRKKTGIPWFFSIAHAILVPLLNINGWVITFYFLVCGLFWFNAVTDSRRHWWMAIRSWRVEYDAHAYWSWVAHEMHRNLVEAGADLPPLPEDEHLHISSDETGICDWPDCFEKVS